MRTDPDPAPILTERLVLRRSRPEDAETISAYRSDPRVRRYQGWERTDPEAVRAEIEAMASRAAGDPGWVQFTVEDRASGRLVGDVGICGVAEEPGVVKVGYTIAPAFQGRGLGTEALRALVDYAFGTLGADRVRMYADADNLASIRVAEKAGLRFVERFREPDGAGGTWEGVRYERHRPDLGRPPSGLKESRGRADGPAWNAARGTNDDRA